MALGLASIFSKLFVKSKGGSFLGSLFGGSDNRENKKQRALTFLGTDTNNYGYGPRDDAPDVIIPSSFVPSTTTFTPPATQVPQIESAPRGQVVRGIGGIILEIERINRNIANIQLALANSASIESKYRKDAIKERQEQIAQRDKFRSLRRAGRRTSGVVGRTLSSVISPVTQAGRSVGTSLVQTGLMLTVSSLVEFSETIAKAIDDVIEKVTEFAGRIEDFAISIRDKFNEILGKINLPSIPDLLEPFTGLFTQQQEQQEQVLSTSNEYLKAAVELIRYVEGTTGKAGASTFFGGGQPYGNLEGLTFNQVADRQRQFLREGRGRFFNKAKGKMDQSAAVGVGQFMYPEQQLRQYLGEDPATTLFTEEKQIELIIAIAAKKRGVDLSKELTLSEIKKLSPEWSGLGRFLQQTTRTEGQSLKIYQDILKRLQSNSGQSSVMPEASKSGALGDPSNPNSPKIGEPVGSYPIAPKSKQVASIGRTVRPPIIIDARVKKSANPPSPPPAFYTQEEVASLEPRLVNTNFAYKLEFAV